MPVAEPMATALARSSGNEDVPSGFSHTESRAPGTPACWISRVISGLVAHSMNFQALSWLLDASLTPSAHDGTLYGLEPSGPAGNGANPTCSKTVEFSSSVRFLYRLLASV